MLSGNQSPLFFRVAKWLLFLGLAWRLHGTKWSWAWILGLPLAGIATHLFYRHKTRGWTRPWGGWRDMEAANPKKRQQGGDPPTAKDRQG